MTDVKKFSKMIAEKPKLFWHDGNNIVSLVETENTVKLYRWDLIAVKYNSISVFAKAS